MVWSAVAMRGTFRGLAAGEPHWLAGLNNLTATAFSQHASLASITLAAAFVLAGAGVVWGATARPALVLAVLLAMFIWVAGEDFGGVLTGHATDPGSGPLLILLAAAFWPQRRAPSPGQPRLSASFPPRSRLCDPQPPGGRTARGQAGSGMVRIGAVVGVSVPPAGSTVTPSSYPGTRPDARTGVVWPFSGLLSRPDGLATDLPSSHSS